MVIGLVTVIACFIFYGKEMGDQRGQFIRKEDQLKKYFLLLTGIISLFFSLWLSSRLMWGCIAEDRTHSKPLSNYGIYERMSQVWVDDDVWIVVLKDQTGRYLAYKTEAMVPRVFQVIPGDRRRYREYQR